VSTTMPARPACVVYRGEPLEVRFWSRVKRNDRTGCWEWTGYCGKRGAGRIRTVGNQRATVTRLVYETLIGPIPRGFVVCHRCDNPPCVYPGHFVAGTVADNNHDMQRKGRARGRFSGVKRRAS
jgi:hypothetical protein